jgi:UDP-glucose 4-epimerase
MKKILITGNSGYIGSHLTKLLEDTYELYGLDTMNPRVDIKHFINCDIRTMHYLQGEYDAVIHLAALVNVGESEKMPSNYYMTNLTGTLNVLNGIKTKNFIFASTGAAEYCQSAYGTSKKAAEDCVREYCTKNNVPYTIFRFYNVIGSTVVEPTNPDGLFYNLIRAIRTKEFTIFGNDYDTVDGTCVRDYVHVMEICEALKLAIEQPSNDMECLGHGVGHTVGEIVNLFREVNDIKNIDLLTKIGPRRQGDLPISVLGNPSSYMKKMYEFRDLLKVDK